jgi:hypothetical protein
MPLILDGTEGITQPSITTAFGLPAGTTAQRPDPAEAGMVRFNTETGLLETYTGSEWSAGVDVEQAIEDFARGEPGQPRIVGQAVAEILSYPVISTTAGNEFTLGAGRGSIVEAVTTSTSNTDNPPTVVGFRITPKLFTGTARFSVAVQIISDTRPATLNYRLRLFKNNTEVANLDGSASFPNFAAPPVRSANADVSLAPDDVFEWRYSLISGGTGVALSAPFITGTNGYIVAEIFKPAF